MAITGREIYEAHCDAVVTFTNEDTEPWSTLSWKEKDAWDKSAHDINCKDLEVEDA